MQVQSTRQEKNLLGHGAVFGATSTVSVEPSKRVSWGEINTTRDLSDRASFTQQNPQSKSGA